MAYTPPENYRVQSGDVLQITVYEHDDLETVTRVGTNGKISFPLLEEVQVAGLTVDQIEKMLKKLLEKDYLVKAHVQVFIEDYHVKQITVIGAVEKPGKYDLDALNDTHVLEAVAMAGGFTDVANINGTRVLRAREGHTQTIPVRITDITKKGLSDQDVVLQSGDIVYVPESFF